ncbi:MAG: thioredoxin [Anaerolineales bacterium]
MNKEEFLEKMRNNPRPVVVDFWAEWCMPCRAMEPALKRVQEAYQDKVDVWRINTDEEPELARSLGILGIPTMIAYKDGVQVVRHTGGQNDRGIQSLFEAALSGSKPANPGIRPVDRIIRLTVGLVLIAFAFQPGFSWIWAVLGALISFSAVYDRCPIWKAITSQFNKHNV